MSLVASMIVRNELDRYLEVSIDHLLTFCDEVRVLDDGSTDGTFEWLRDREGVAVRQNPASTFFADEGAARQALLEWTFEARAKYVLAIDADELVGEPEAVLEAVSAGDPVFTLSLVEVWKATQRALKIRVDGHWKPRTVPILYRPPAQTGGRWRIANRRLACGREPLAVVRASRRAPATGAEVLHFGWARKVEREARAERYFEHDAGRFHADKHLRSILWPDSLVELEPRPWPSGLDYRRREIAGRVARR